MRAVRLLLLAPMFLLLGAASYTETYWYSIFAADGARIGYGYSEQISTPDGLVVTDYVEITLRTPYRPAWRMTDRMVKTWDHNARPREIVERIDNGSERIELRTIVGADEAIVTRTTRAGKQVGRVALPARLLAYDIFPPSRCVPTDWGPIFELNAATMAVDRVVDDDAPDAGSGTNEVIRRRFQGDKLRAVELMSYDGDCHLVAVVKTLFGMRVTIRPASGEDVLKDRGD